MNFKVIRKYLSRPPSCWRASFVGMFLGVALSSPSVHAAAPEALTNIGNTATATFTDSDGKASTVTSNPVVTVVQQVGAFSLDGVTGLSTNIINNKTGVAGGNIYAPHVLTNTGNGKDSFNISIGTGSGQFSKVEVYADDGTGNPTGAALCSSLTAAACTVTSPVSIPGSNGTFKFVAAYTIPAAAISVSSPFETSTLTVTPVPASAALYAVGTVTAKDSVNLTTSAAFNMSKSIGTPAVSAPLGGTWPTASRGGKASTGTNCPTTWSASFSSSATCIYTVYTLTFSNVGGGAGRFALSDTLPSGLTYVSGSAVWSSGGGSALTDAAGGDPAGIDFLYEPALTRMTAVVSSIRENVTQTLSFVVLVNPTASTGNGSTTNTANYSSIDAIGATVSSPGSLPSKTGSTPYSVFGSYGVALGSAVSSSSNAADTTAGTPNATVNDTTTVASLQAGGTAKFRQTVYNTGNATDTINIAVNLNNFPAGSTYFLYGSDGATPLNDTGVTDGIRDTGPVPAYGQVTIVVSVTLPIGLTVGPVTYSAIVTATSKSDSTKSDTTRDSLSTVTAGLVDLTNTATGNGRAGSLTDGDVGPGPSPRPTVINTANPGIPTAFNLFIANNDSIDHTYNLAASSSSNFPGTLPPNWTVRFVAGSGASCAASSPVITDTGSVSSGRNIAVTACVTAPATQVAVFEKYIYFKIIATTATSDGFFASDVITDAVTVVVASTYSATIVGHNLGQLSSPGTTTYTHSLQNTGNQACGPYTLEVKFPSDAIGWTSAVYIDTDNNARLGKDDVLVTGPITTPLLPGADKALSFLVRIGAPAGLSPGASSKAVISAVFGGVNSCGTVSVTNISSITAGAIRLSKLQAVDAQCRGIADAALAATSIQVKPGGCILYEVTATNDGIAAVSNLTINDSAPSYTTLSASQPAVKCAAVNVSGNSPVYSASGKTVSCGSPTNTVNPGGSVTLDYSVIIDN
jgi:uncharacterized repeat protein (TIGR01451 family)